MQNSIILNAFGISWTFIAQFPLGSLLRVLRLAVTITGRIRETAQGYFHERLTL